MRTSNIFLTTFYFPKSGNCSILQIASLNFTESQDFAHLFQLQQHKLCPILGAQVLARAGGAGGGIEPAQAKLGGFVQCGRGEALQNEVAGLPVGEPEALRVGGVEAVGVGQLAAVGGEAVDELLARGGGNGRNLPRQHQIPAFYPFIPQQNKFIAKLYVQ